MVAVTDKSQHLISTTSPLKSLTTTGKVAQQPDCPIDCCRQEGELWAHKRFKRFIGLWALDASGSSAFSFFVFALMMCRWGWLVLNPTSCVVATSRSQRRGWPLSGVGGSTRETSMASSFVGDELQRVCPLLQRRHRKGSPAPCREDSGRCRSRDSWHRRSCRQAQRFIFGEVLHDRCRRLSSRTVCW